MTAIEQRLEPIPPAGSVRLRAIACDAAGSCAARDLGAFAWRLRPPTATARAR